MGQTENEQDGEPTIEDRIWSWAEQLPDWQSDLLRRLCERDPLGDADYEHAVALLLAECGDADAAPATAERLTREHLPSQQPRPASPVLREVGDISGAGLLAEGQRLSFAPQLTVIYGKNGAGKSTYGKVLKAACRPGAEGVVLSNVFTTDEGPGEAELVIAQRGTERTLRRRHHEGPSSVLRSFSIFDDHTAAATVDGQNRFEGDFVPAPLRVLTRLVAATDEVKRRISDMAKAEDHQRAVEFDGSAVELLEKMQSENDDGAVIELMKDAAVVARLEQLDRILQLSEDEARCTELAERASAIQRLRSNMSAYERDLADRCLRISALQQQIDEAEKAASSMARAAGDLGLAAATGSRSWRTMWRASGEVHRAEEADRELAEAAHCPLCRQHIGTEARERFQYFARLASEEAVVLVDSLETELEAERRQLLAIRPPHVGSVAGALSGPAVEEIEAWRAEAERLQHAIHGGEQPQLSFPSLDALLAAAAQLTLEIRRARATQNDEEREKALAERERLQARVHLASLDRAAYQASVRRSAVLKQARGEAQSKRISHLQKDLANTAYTQALKDAFREERIALGLEHLPIELDAVSRKGATVTTVQLRDAETRARVRDVMSAGERWALGLAFFLAEARVAQHGGGLILDDPVSSLDHERLDHVAKRLVEAAGKRQVIVFTHDIGLVHRLGDLSERAGLAHVQEVVVFRHHARAGYIAGKEWLLGKGRTHVGKLRERLAEMRKLEKTDPEAYEWNCCALMVHLRRAWERAVEETLLNRAVQRFSPQISPSSLAKVRVTKEDVDTITTNYSACSWPIHDQPHLHRLGPPTYDEAKKLVDEYDNFIRRKKQQR